MLIANSAILFFILLNIGEGLVLQPTYAMVQKEVWTGKGVNLQKNPQRVMSCSMPLSGFERTTV